MDALLTYDEYEDINIFEEDDDSEEDPDFLEFVVLVHFPRNPRIFRDRPNHYDVWTDEEFLLRFRLSKRTVNFLTEIIKDRISSLRTRYSLQLVSVKYYYLKPSHI